MRIPESLAGGVEIIRQTLQTLPSAPGVYRMLNESGQALYIGKATRLNQRVASYAQVSRLPHRLRRMVAELNKIEVVETHTEIEAVLLENNLIKSLQPPYNVLLKDDKSFPYIIINQGHVFPRLAKYRSSRQPNMLYFGPFASTTSVNETLTLLYKLFQLRSCSDSFFAKRNRPCLQYYIKRCTAPCVGKVSIAEYAEQVTQTIEFFRGNTNRGQQFFSQKMEQASQAMAYEEAAQLRDRLKLLAQVQAHQRINVPGLRTLDVLGHVQKDGKDCVQLFCFREGRNYGTESFFLDHHEGVSREESLRAFVLQFYAEHAPPELILVNHAIAEADLVAQALEAKHGVKIQFVVPRFKEKKELVEHAVANAEAAIRRKLLERDNFSQALTLLQETFALEKRPERIEIYDNSHIQGTNPYGVMVVATAKGFERKSYRKFSLKSASTPESRHDDYAMMRELIERRFAHSESWPLPELVLIDGGLGHLRVTQAVLERLNVEGVQLMAIAKGPERNAGREHLYLPQYPEAIALPLNSPLLYFLQRLRDEAHRFAISAHRSGRKKQLVKSVLDEIPGVGPKRKKTLLLHFGSVKGIRQAGISDLERVQGIDKATAQKIYSFFH